MSELRDSLIAFLADPKGFMATNIVLPPSSPTSNPVAEKGSGIFQFSWAKSNKIGKRGGNIDCAIYRVENPDNFNTRNPRFMAYYCHYDTDKTYDLMLGHKMDLLLTPTMNGCSFGVGSETMTGERRVAHANVSRTSGSQEGLEQQRLAQAENIGKKIANPNVFGPDKYIAAHVFGTTVGVHKDRNWSFYMQVWKRPTSNDYILDQIKDIA